MYAEVYDIIRLIIETKNMI